MPETLPVLSPRQVIVLLLRGRWLQLLGTGVALNLGLVVLPLFAMLVYDKVLHNGIFETLWALAIGALLFLSLELLLRQKRVREIERLASGLDAQIDQRLISNILKPSSRSSAQPGAAARLLTIYRDLLQAREFFSATYVLALADLPLLVFVGVIIGVIAWPLLIVVVLCLTLYVYVGTRLKHRISNLSKHVQKHQTAKLAFLTDVMSSLDVLRTSAAGAHSKTHFEKLGISATSATRNMRLEAILLQHWTQALYFISYVSLVVAGAYLVYYQHLSMGGLIAVSMLSGRALGVAGQALLTLGRWEELKQCTEALMPYLGGRDIVSLSVYSREGGVFDPALLPPSAISQETDQEPVLHRTRQAIAGRLTLRNIEHGFGSGQFSLKLDKLQFQPGERIGLLGRPGSGKSTLLRILSGAIEPNQGQVEVDDVCLSGLSPDDRFQWLSFKPQESGLVAGTLESIILSNLPVTATEQERVSALEFALHHSTLREDIDRGAMTLDQHIEEFGANLSGGQRQKVAIARAMATRPRILLLDEPNAGLDTESERLMASRLQSLESVSLVIISHSALMLGMTDRLVALDQGRIIADGPTRQLLVT